MFELDLFGRRERVKEDLIFIISMLAAGHSKDDVARLAARRMCCCWCRMGLPFNEDGDHELMGIVIPCEYEEPDDAE